MANQTVNDLFQTILEKKFVIPDDIKPLIEVLKTPCKFYKGFMTAYALMMYRWNNETKNVSPEQKPKIRKTLVDEFKAIDTKFITPAIVLFLSKGNNFNYRKNLLIASLDDTKKIEEILSFLDEKESYKNEELPSKIKVDLIKSLLILSDLFNDRTLSHLSSSIDETIYNEALVQYKAQWNNQAVYASYKRLENQKEKKIRKDKIVNEMKKDWEIEPDQEYYVYERIYINIADKKREVIEDDTIIEKYKGLVFDVLIKGNMSLLNLNWRDRLNQTEYPKIKIKKMLGSELLALINEPKRKTTYVVDSINGKYKQKVIIVKPQKNKIIEPTEKPNEQQIES